MVKKLIMGLVVCSISTANGMNMDSQRKVCLLLILEPAIRNIIAQYLPFKDRETDTELTERMEQDERFRNNMILSRTFMRLQKPASNCDHAIHYDNTIESYSINRLKKLLLCRNTPYAKKLNKLCIWSGQQPFLQEAVPACKIQIEDVETGVVTDNAALTALVQKENNDCITHITLSPDGVMLATVNQQLVLGNMLVLRHKKTGEKKEIMLPYIPYGISLIGFNKQGTKVIARGKPERKGYDPEIRNHIVKIVSDEECQKKDEKTFDEFLYQHGICKKLA